MSLLYFDYAATTPLDPRVLQAMMPYLTDVFYNASSTHAGGLQAQQAVMQSRMTIARQIGAKMSEIVFTSGATEAINLAILGLTRKARNGESGMGNGESGMGTRNTIVTTGTEHAAVRDALEHCRECDWNIVHLPVNEHGVVDLDAARELVTTDTLMVCVMAVNNETGVIQDLKALADIAHERGAVFMTDATQAYGKIPLNVDELGIDLMTFSGHKIYGPKGVGVLYCRNPKHAPTNLEPLAFGGGQEGGIRSGTLNVPGIVAMAEAGRLAFAEHQEEVARVRALRDRFEQAMLQLGDARVNGAGAPRSYNISNITFAESDVDAMLLDVPHLAMSKGSACSSAKPKPSHVLSAMGRTELEAARTLRCSFGRFTTDAEVDQLIADLTAAHEKARVAVT